MRLFCETVATQKNVFLSFVNNGAIPCCFRGIVSALLYADSVTVIPLSEEKNRTIVQEVSCGFLPGALSACGRFIFTVYK